MIILIGLVLASVLVPLVVIGLIARSQSYEDPRGPVPQMFKALKPGQQPKAAELFEHLKHQPVELLPAIPGHRHMIGHSGRLDCGCRWPWDSQEPGQQPKGRV